MSGELVTIQVPMELALLLAAYQTGKRSGWVRVNFQAGQVAGYEQYQRLPMNGAHPPSHVLT